MNICERQQTNPSDLSSTEPEMVAPTEASVAPLMGKLGSSLLVASLCVLSLASVASLSFWFGSKQAIDFSSLQARAIPQEVLRATATHGGPNLAVATGRVSDEAEGIFFLDYITGNLQCWVYYPRLQRFGAKFFTNITQQLPSTKNAEYLLVTGDTQTAATASNARPAGCLVYVVDVKSGLFAAYTMPWTRAAEASGQFQEGPMIAVDGGQYRAPLPGNKAVKPPNIAKDKPAEDKKPAEKDAAAAEKNEKK